MTVTDEDSVLELGARFHAAQQEAAASVRIDGLVQEDGVQGLGEGDDETGAPDDQPEDVERSVCEEAGPSLLGNAVSERPELATQCREERTADDERDQNGVDEGLDDVPLGRWHVLGSVMGLELAEEQLDHPAGGVGLGDVVRGELRSEERRVGKEWG